MTGDRRLESVHRPITGARVSGTLSPGVPTSGALRVARGAAVGAAAMGLALAGHLVGGGSLPTATAALILLGLTIAGSIALSGRRWTASALLTVLLGVQVVFHVVFGSHPAAAAGQQHAAHSLSASMVLAHLLAAVTAALLLRRGESWCWRLVAMLSRRVHIAWVLGSVHLPASPARSVHVGVGMGSLPLLRSLLLADAQPRRGPPALPAR